mgnify:CR=1 FL=1|jgi:Predicted transcriptional regulators
MVEYNDTRLDIVFGALADGTRRAMLRRLAEGPMKVTDLAEPYAISLAAASKHIKVLEAAGLVRREVRGRTHICRLDAAPMHAGAEWLRHYEAYWTRKLDTLEELIRGEIVRDNEQEKDNGHRSE